MKVHFITTLSVLFALFLAIPNTAKAQSAVAGFLENLEECNAQLGCPFPHGYGRSPAWGYAISYDQDVAKRMTKIIDSLRN